MRGGRWCHPHLALYPVDIRLTLGPRLPQIRQPRFRAFVFSGAKRHKRSGSSRSAKWWVPRGAPMYWLNYLDQVGSLLDHSEAQGTIRGETPRCRAVCGGNEIYDRFAASSGRRRGRQHFRMRGQGPRCAVKCRWLATSAPGVPVDHGDIPRACLRVLRRALPERISNASPHRSAAFENTDVGPCGAARAALLDAKRRL